MAAMWNHLPAMAAKMRELGTRLPRVGGREIGDLVAFLYFLGSEEGAGSAEAGRKIFENRGCVRCHQVGGRGGVIGPALDQSAGTTTPVGLATGLWNHATAMTGRMRQMGISPPTLSSRDISDLVAFFSLSRDSAAAVPAERVWVLPGQPSNGRAIVEEKGCATCHAIAGHGGGMAPDLAATARGRSVEAFLAAMWNKGSRMRAAFAARGEEPPTFDPAQMVDVVAYLQSLGYFAEAGTAGRGERRLGSSGCLRCHGWGRRGETAGDLRQAGPFGGFGDRMAALWNHIGVIGSTRPDAGEWPKLTPTEMADLLQFLGTVPK